MVSRSQRFSSSLLGFLWKLFLIVSGVVAYGQEKPAVLPLVHVSKATEGYVSQTADYVGTVVPSRRSIVGSAVDGRVVKLTVEIGDEVKEGEPIAEILTKTLELEIAAAKAELKIREAELEELKNGALPQEIAQAKSRVAAAVARRDYLKKRFERFTKLQSGSGGSGIVSEEELQEVESLLQASEELVSESEEALALVEQGPRKERIAQAEARLDQQSNQVALLEDRLAKYTVRSPFNGFVIRELTEAGYWVSQGDPVAELIEIDIVEIEVFVPENFIRFVKVGEQTELKLEAIPDLTEPLIGKVVTIVPEAEVKSRTFPVRVRLQNPRVDNSFLVKPGMLARCSLPIGQVKKAILIPKDALVLGQSGYQVMVIKDGKVKKVTTELGLTQGSWVEAKSGISVGDELAVFGNERLRDGEQVKIGKVIEPEPMQAAAKPDSEKTSVSDGG